MLLQARLEAREKLREAEKTRTLPKIRREKTNSRAWQAT